MGYLACHVARPWPEHIDPCMLQHWEHCVRSQAHSWDGAGMSLVCLMTVFRLFYWQLPGHARSQGGQLKRYKDSLRINLKMCDIPASSWESLAENRCKWQQLCNQQIALFYDNHLHELSVTKLYVYLSINVIKLYLCFLNYPADNSKKTKIQTKAEGQPPWQTY